MNFITAGTYLSRALKLHNLQRARLLSQARYAYGRGKTLYNKLNSLSPTHRAMVSNAYRQLRARAATVTNKRRMRQALIRAQRRSIPRPRPMRITRSRYAGRDIRILRKAKLCWWRRNQYLTTPQGSGYSWATGSNSTNFPTAPSLKTIRTYYSDSPWQFDVSKFIAEHAQPFLTSDSKQSTIDIQSIMFNFTFLNYQPDVDMKIRILLLRQVRDEQADALAQQSHSDKLPDFWQDPVDKFERHDFDTGFSENDFDVNFKDYSPPSKRWKVWSSKIVTLRSNPHSGFNQYLAVGQNLDFQPAQNDETTMITNNYKPNMTTATGGSTTQTYDMNINRIQGYPGQNERKCIMNWIPKGGYRFQFIDFDQTSTSGSDLDQSRVPKDDIRLLILPFEDTKDVSRKSTPHELGYRFEATLKFKDLL